MTIPPVPKPITHSARPRLAAAVVFVVTAVVAAALGWRLEEYRLQEERAEVFKLAGAHATALQLNMERAFSASYSLAALVRQGHGAVPDFDSVAREMLPFYPSIAALELAPGGVVRHIVPLTGNEGALGHDVLSDPVRDREARLARETGRLTLAGPFELRQSGVGAVARLPVFLGDHNGKRRFWGFVCVLLRFPDTLAPAMLSRLTAEGYQYQLWRINPDTGQKQIIAASSPSLSAPVHSSLDLPNSRWILSVAPARGWRHAPSIGFMTLLGVLASLSLAWLAKLLVESKEHEAGLEALVEERTAEIRESEERLRLLADNLPDSYVYQYTRANGSPRFLQLSAGVERVHGLKAEEVLSRGDILHRQLDPDQLSALLAAEGASASGMTDLHMEMRATRLDGQMRWLQLRSRPRRKGAGEVVWDGVATDITKRKETEVALRAERDFSDAVLNALPSVFYMCDRRLKLLRWNQRLEEVSGYGGGELAAMGPLDFFAGEERERVASSIRQVFEHGEGEVEVEALFRGKDGSETPYYFTGIRSSICDGDCLLGVGIDISERKLTEKALEDARVAAEAANSAKSQFLANMSHELRTPMAAILGVLHLALQEELAPATRQYLESAMHSSRSLLRILNDILDMTKIVSGRLSVVEEPFLLHRCVEEAREIISFEAQQKGLPISLSVAPQVPAAVTGDQVRLRQILLNLIGNAVKFTREGGVEVRVSAGGERADGKREITFAIADTGIGIPEEKKDLIFRAFSQVDPSISRSFGGTGLGLAISSEIVRLLGGSITFESAQGRGSTFSFTIPLGEAPPEGGTPAPPEPAPAPAPPAGAGELPPRLLVVEDDPVIRTSMAKILRLAQFRVEVAEDGQEGVEMWQEGGYDLILMDVQMPRLDGLAATRAIREKERRVGGHIPIVAVTAHALEEDRAKCLAAGMDDYVSKPVDVRKVIELARELLS